MPSPALPSADPSFRGLTVERESDGGRTRVEQEGFRKAGMGSRDCGTRRTGSDTGGPSRADVTRVLPRGREGRSGLRAPRSHRSCMGSLELHALEAKLPVLARELIAEVGGLAEAVEVAFLCLPLPVNGRQGVLEACAAQSVGVPVTFRFSLTPRQIASYTLVLHATSSWSPFRPRRQRAPTHAAGLPAPCRGSCLHRSMHSRAYIESCLPLEKETTATDMRAKGMPPADAPPRAIPRCSRGNG